MEEIIKKGTMTSLEIAEVTGKQHAHVMRDIRNLVEKINESGSGLVDFSKDYHRGDKTQYKYLSENTQNTILDWCFGKDNVSNYLIESSTYKDAKGEERSVYVLNKKACLLLASGYDVVLRAKIINRWEELETGKATPYYISNKEDEVRACMAWVKGCKELLNLSDASTLALMKKVADPLGLPTPDYVPSKGILKSASELLKSRNTGISAQAFNKLAIKEGFLEEKTRPSSNGKTKTFKAITSRGEYYGENQTSPNNPKETQPLWYEEKFEELLTKLLGE